MATEVGSAAVTIFPSASGFGRSLDRMVGGASDKSGRRGGRMFGTAFARTSAGPIRAGFGSIGKAAIGAFAGLAAGKFLKGTIDAASDLQESASKVNVVFGKQGPAILKASQTSAKAMGLSKRAYLDATGTLGNLLVSLDLAPAKAAGMSQKMVKLAGDLASFNNVDPAEALDALRSGLVGETEPLKRFGVNMNEATLKAQALKMGLIKSTKEALTPQQKALAATRLIMKQTGTAQGDFQRTSKGLANQQRILAAQFDDTKGKIGAVLLPAMTSIVSTLNEKVIPAVEDFGGKVGDFAAPLVAKAREVAPKIGTAISEGFATVKITMAPVIAQIVQGVKDASAQVITGVKTGLDTGNWAPLGTSIGNALVTAIRGAGSAIASITKVIGDLFGKVDWVGVGIMMGKQAPSLLIGLAAGLLNFDLMGLLSGVAKHWQDIVLAVIAVAFTPGKIISKVAGLLGRIPLVGRLLAWALEHFAGFSKGLVRMVGDALGFMGRAFLEGFRRVFPAAGSALARGLSLLPTRIGVAAIELVEAAGRMMTRLRNAIVSRIGAVISGFGEIVGRLVARFANANSILIDAGRRIVQGLIDGIKSKIGAVGDAIGSVASTIRNHMPFSPAKEGPLKFHPMDEAGENIMRDLAAGLRKGGQKAKDAMGSAVQSMADKLSSLKDAAANVRSSVADSVRGIVDISQVGAAIVTGQDANGNDITRTPAISETFSGFAAQAKAFAAALAEMARKKFAPAIIAAVAAAGPAQGLTAAQAFANAPQSEVAAVNASMGQIQAAAAAAGNTVLQTTRLPKDIAREEAQLAALRRIANAVEGATVVKTEIKGDDLLILVNRAQKKKAAR